MLRFVVGGCIRIPKRSRKIPSENLKQLRGKIKILVRRLDGNSDSNALEIVQRANHWLKVDSRSHWAKYKTGEDVSSEVSQIKERGGEIVLHYNLTFGDKGFL